MQKIILNKTRKHNDRYTLINNGRGMGGYGQAPDHYLCNWFVATGFDHPESGYPSHTSIDYFLTLGYVPEEVKDKVRRILDIVREHE